MATFDVLDLKKKKVGEIELSEEMFAAELKEHLLWEAVKWQTAGWRRGTASTKKRGEVSGNNAKMYRQKGTGRARHGDHRSPTMVGGGVAFGPKPKDWSYELPKKVRRSALKQALTLRKNQAKLIILKDFALPGIKTKALKDILDAFDAASSLIVDKKNENLLLSARNLKGVKVLYPEGLNVYDILKFKTLILTEESAKQIEKRFKR
ncbi:MAG: 50S ribosomal protein L4 [Myxococcota bacterium]